MPELARVLTSDAEIDAAIRQARAYEKYDRRVLRAVYSARTDRLLLYMDNGVTHMIPRRLLQGLVEARPAGLHKIELLGGGTGLYWPALDVAHYVPGLLSGVYGSEKWMKRLKEAQQSPRNGGGRSGRRTIIDRRAMSHRSGGKEIEIGRGNTLIRALRKKHGDDFLTDFHGDAKLSAVRAETDMSLTELVRQHRRRK